MLRSGIADGVASRGFLDLRTGICVWLPNTPTIGALIHERSTGLPHETTRLKVH
jgi:hypothetical protein